MQACKVRLATQLYCESVLVSAVDACADVGSISIFFSRMNVFVVRSGASSSGILSHEPKSVLKEAASGHASARSGASAA